ncbi:MAG: retropepsin-like aspartic protease, partial [Gemmatimonadaceae bacterium]
MKVLGSLCLLLVVASPVHAQRDSVSTLVDRYVAWRGGVAYRDVTSIHEQGRVSAAGLTGTFERFAGRDGREYTHARLGSIESATGVSPAGNWNENQGVVQEMDSGSAVDTRRSIALELGDALLGRGGASVTRVPDESRDGSSWAVLRVTFGGPDRYDVFLYGATGALDGWRITEDRVTHFRRFGEWRTVSGVRMPFLTEDLYDNRAENSVQHDDSIALGAPLPDSLFARPASVKMARFGGGRTESDPVPFTFFRQRQIYIAAKVNGHPVDLLLDSGAGRTVIDKTYADSIGLTTEGKGVANGTGGQMGTSFARDVLVTVGTMTLRVPTAVVIDLSGVEKLVGRPMHVILGADVFKEVVVDIDFAKHSIAFHDPATFHPPAGADTVPITPGASSRTVPVRIENGPPVQVDFD